MINARTQVVVYVSLVLAFSWGYETLIISLGGVKEFGTFGIIVLMWIPGLISIFQRIISKVGFADVGLRRGPSKFYFFAVGIPFIIALSVNLVCMALDIRNLEVIGDEEFHNAVPAISMSLGLGLFGALGEELGWRGFLLPKMHEAKVSKPYLCSGLIWAIWHLPIVVFGGFYAHGEPALMALSYTSSIVAINFMISDLRDKSGSLWVAVVFHAAHNFLFQLAIPYFIFSKPGQRIELWETVGADCGLLVAAVYSLANLMKKLLPPRGRPSNTCS